MPEHTLMISKSETLNSKTQSPARNSSCRVSEIPRAACGLRLQRQRPENCDSWHCVTGRLCQCAPSDTTRKCHFSSTRCRISHVSVEPTRACMPRFAWRMRSSAARMVAAISTVYASAFCKAWSADSRFARTAQAPNKRRAKASTRLCNAPGTWRICGRGQPSIPAMNLESAQSGTGFIFVSQLRCGSPTCLGSARCPPMLEVMQRRLLHAARMCQASSQSSLRRCRKMARSARCWTWCSTFLVARALRLAAAAEARSRQETNSVC
mmetsp:Transcript_32339/g.66684  ORF Transcript_32339/g.66684 Transcript_32339/m.66684 type:complete len:266 (-) Transcript_32339:241-1038(-)